METLLIAIGAGIAFIVAYHTYGRWLGGKVFQLASATICPSERLRDDKDYVPTTKPIVFGHHFTSIAGTGPIVGPAIAVMWGWLPALLWVVLGSIFIGAVHDFGALVVSLRNNGQTVGDIAGRVLNRRVRLLFLFVLFMALTIVLAIFGLVIAGVFGAFKQAIFPCLIQIPIAIVIGVYLHRRGVNLFIPSIIALVIMYLAVIWGNVGVLGWFNETLSQWHTLTWVVLLLAYSYVASVLPVWTLLQPRDYINSLQLISALVLIVVGLCTAAFLGGAPVASIGERPPLEIAAPLIDFEPKNAPVIFPFLFITIACGAISGFHCLVSSGTSSKQLQREPDARFVGFGGMLTEGFLATLVILACVSGLGLGISGAGETVLLGEEAWAARYSDWHSMRLPQKVGAFVDGSANFLRAFGMPRVWAVALMGVLVASFAGTTLDTACRLQRYVVQELAGTFLSRKGFSSDEPLFGDRVNQVTATPLTWLANKHGATLFAIGIACAMAALPPPGAAWTMKNAGKGGFILWPMFGATNQLLGGLSFLVITFYLWRRSKPVFFLVLPLLFMLVMPAWAMIMSLPGWIDPPSGNPNWPLVVIAIATLALEAWMIFESILLFPRVRGVLETKIPDVAALHRQVPTSPTCHESMSG